MLSDKSSLLTPYQTASVPAAGPGSQSQLSFFEDAAARDRWETIERTMDYIRGRYGHHSIDVALMSMDKKLGKLDAKKDNVIHPVGYF